ncbi:apolipoprotein D-like [Tropilaelaps mercedesae]|uniref:Apolipoprotein D-like n=1 Tax=Tropilaelaps mercedesae TaxID=418985 RepID=A0A1V9WZI0_9ACAR|nr:apolipoprotein D-like [Tropilaelaps mercedesae]
MSCLKVNITRQGDEDLKITEYRRFGLLQKALDHTLIDIGVLKIPDPTEPAKMTVKFSLTFPKAARAKIMIIRTVSPLIIDDYEYTNSDDVNETRPNLEENGPH